MKCLVVALALVGFSSAQILARPQIVTYRTSPGSADGQYHPDNSGAYVPDDLGAYVHSDAGYRHQEDKYRHQADRFGGNGGAGGAGRLTGNIAVIRPVAVQATIPVGLKQGNAAGYYDNRNYAIIRKTETVDPDGYQYLYETENGILAEEQGKLKNVGQQDEAMDAAGYFTYTGPDNVVYRVDYTANENGFQPVGDHIPTPPPIPEAIARALEYQRAAGTL